MCLKRYHVTSAISNDYLLDITKSNYLMSIKCESLDGRKKRGIWL